MRWFLIKHITFVVASVILLSACKASQAVPTVDLQEQITQTMQAVATDSQLTLQAATPTIASATKTPLPTDTPLPTATPAPTETPVPVSTETSEPTASPVPKAMVRIAQNTNCRSGPSTAFPIVFVALQGESLTIVSGTTLDKYVIVENPNDPSQRCWLWTEFSDIQGTVTGLPVATPPPTPTPALKYSLSFLQIEPCTGWSLAFKVINTGSKTLQSYTVVATDQTTNHIETTALNDFSERVNCGIPIELGSVDPGLSGYIYANAFNSDPKGHSLLVYVTICSNNDMAGECESQGFIITP